MAQVIVISDDEDEDMLNRLLILHPTDSRRAVRTVMNPSKTTDSIIAEAVREFGLSGSFTRQNLQLFCGDVDENTFTHPTVDYLLQESQKEIRLRLVYFEPKSQLHTPAPSPPILTDSRSKSAPDQSISPLLGITSESSSSPQQPADRDRSSSPDIEFVAESKAGAKPAEHSSGIVGKRNVEVVLANSEGLDPGLPSTPSKKLKIDKLALSSPIRRHMISTKPVKKHKTTSASTQIERIAVDDAAIDPFLTQPSHARLRPSDSQEQIPTVHDDIRVLKKPNSYKFVPKRPQQPPSPPSNAVSSNGNSSKVESSESFTLPREGSSKDRQSATLATAPVIGRQTLDSLVNPTSSPEKAGCTTAQPLLYEKGQPASSWISYKTDKIVQLENAKMIGTSSQNVSTQHIAGLWNAEPLHVKERYHRLAGEERTEHTMQRSGHVIRLESNPAPDRTDQAKQGSPNLSSAKQNSVSRHASSTRPMQQQPDTDVTAKASSIGSLSKGKSKFTCADDTTELETPPKPRRTRNRGDPSASLRAEAQLLVDHNADGRALESIEVLWRKSAIDFSEEKTVEDIKLEVLRFEQKQKDSTVSDVQEIHVLNGARLLRDEEILLDLERPRNLQVIYQAKPNASDNYRLRLHLATVIPCREPIDVEVPRTIRRSGGSTVLAVWDMLQETFPKLDPRDYHFVMKDFDLDMHYDTQLSIFMDRASRRELSVIRVPSRSLKVGYRVRNERKIYIFKNVSIYISVAMFKQDYVEGIFKIPVEQQDVYYYRNKERLRLDYDNKAIFFLMHHKTAEIDIANRLEFDPLERPKSQEI